MHFGLAIGYGFAAAAAAIEHGRFAQHHAGREAHESLPHGAVGGRCGAEDVDRAGRDDVQPVARVALPGPMSQARIAERPGQDLARGGYIEVSRKRIVLLKRLPPRR